MSDSNRMRDSWLTPKQIGPMFRKAAKLPNVALPMSFWDALKLHPIEPRFEADYVCLDVETANSYRSSICSIGVVWVKGRQIICPWHTGRVGGYMDLQAAPFQWRRLRLGTQN